MSDEAPDPITIDQWYDHLVANGDDSYSLAHCLAALYLVEYGAEDESDWDAKATEAMSAMTGFQVGAAYSIARQIRPLFENRRAEVKANKQRFVEFLEKAAEDGTLLVFGDDSESRP